VQPDGALSTRAIAEMRDAMKNGDLAAAPQLALGDS
jgi:hypothetical protein